MSNMPHCRFRNTLSDLYDCYSVMPIGRDDLTNDEYQALKQLIKLCKQIAEFEIA